MEDRYSRNVSSITEEENRRLKSFKVCVIGCGGLGGYIIEMLGRIGIGTITAVDYDRFEETNLNRQILSDTTNLGQSKSLAALERMKKVNPEITLNNVDLRFDSTSGEEIIRGSDVVVDALDNPQGKRLAGDLCAKLNIPLVHGAIAGWYGQVTTVYPGDKAMDVICKEGTSCGIEKELGNPPFTPAFLAAIQTAEVIKILLKKGGTLRNKILYADLLNMEFDIVELKK
ncbi:MAG: UBA/THIF-type binding protein [Firmicutes bacterium]|nr:UBA/THIF-type binding protein [Bacillota bacterium]